MSIIIKSENCSYTGDLPKNVLRPEICGGLSLTVIVDESARNGREDHGAEDAEHSLQTQIAFTFDDDGQTGAFEENHDAAEENGVRDAHHQVHPERQLRVELDRVVLISAERRTLRLDDALRTARLVDDAGCVLSAADPPVHVVDDRWIQTHRLVERSALQTADQSIIVHHLLDGEHVGYRVIQPQRDLIQRQIGGGRIALLQAATLGAASHVQRPIAGEENCSPQSGRLVFFHAPVDGGSGLLEHQSTRFLVAQIAAPGGRQSYVFASVYLPLAVRRVEVGQW